MKIDYRYRRRGTLFAVIAEAEGYLMMRCKGCVPFVVFKKDLEKNFYDTRKDAIQNDTRRDSEGL